ncbi:MAG: SIS domain-containing protein [Rhodobacter sp.]|nr:SIS domain-containing protein [Rhodobacter sp.]
MNDTSSQMRREILQIPQAVDRLLTDGTPAIRAAADALRALDPPMLATVARGSSDHVATYLKYVSELLMGVPVASIGPSVASIYKAPLKLQGSACISVSQSGQSPDIVDLAKSAGRGGALTVAITNNPDSPLALASRHCLDIHAGPELSVAATKTFVTSLVAGMLMLAEWRGEDGLVKAIHNLPEALEQATRIDWPEVRAATTNWDSLYTVGRGPAFAISNEAALKFKEVCLIHAESYSSAELLHGPVSIVGQGFPVLGFAANDAAEDALVQVADQVAAKGAAVFVTSTKARTATKLDHVGTDHPLTDSIALIVSFYAMVEKTATERGIDPDTPRHLKKVTETV